MSNKRKDRIARALRFVTEDDYTVTAPSARSMSNGRIKAGAILVPPGILKTLGWALKEVAKKEEVR